MNEFINLTEENINKEHICCIIRSKVKHNGIEEKKKWLKERIKEGHIFRKLDVKGTVFIEYAPLETAWTPIEGENYIYIYCLWVCGEYKGKGYGKSLMEYCINYAKEKGKSGICMIGSNKQKTWLSDQSFAKKYGFKIVDGTNNGYQLLALSFDNKVPRFTKKAKEEKIDNKELTIYYGMQCPFISQKVELIKEYCNSNNIPLNLMKVDTLKKSKNLPCAFNNFAVFYNGRFETLNIIDVNYTEKLIKKQLK